MKIIARQQYIEHIRRFIGKGMIIALTGQRRVGKSYIIRQLVTEIEAGNPDANIIYINKEKTKYADIRNADDLSRYLDSKLKEDAENYLLIDEVQDIDGFENVLRSLNADDKTMEREFGNLLKIQDNYPKYVISMNPMSRPQNYEGIKHLTLRQFLMSDNL